MSNAKKKTEKKKCSSTGCVRGAGHDGMHGTTKPVPTAEAAALEAAARRDILHLICKWWSPAVAKGRADTLEGAIGLLDTLLGERHGARHAQFEHLGPMIDALERVRAGEPLRVLISAPPQHGKTALLRHFITSDLVNCPHHVSVYATYSMDKARAEGRLVREAASRSGVKLEMLGGAEGTWLRNLHLQAPEFGIFIPTVNNIGCIYVDDPIKDAEEAESPKIRDDIFGWFQFDLRQRVGANIPIVVVGARWHHDDLIGRLSAEKDPSGKPVWTLINLPAIDDYGAPLWPEGRPLADLLKIKRTLTARFWSALYMGRPDPEEDAVRWPTSTGRG